MSLRHALLGLLADRPATGYELKQRFERSLSNVWFAQSSQIYPELARLKDKGLIRQTAAGPRGSKTYELTDEGLNEVQNWLTRTEPSHASKNEALLRVYFYYVLDPEQADALVRKEIEFHRDQLAQYEEVQAPPDAPLTVGQRFAQLLLEWGLRYERGIIEWLEWTRGEMGKARAPSVRRAQVGRRPARARRAR